MSPRARLAAQHAERRIEARGSIELAALCRTSHSRTTVTVVEISTQGCRMVADQAPLAPGNELFVRLNGFDAMHGQVRWCEDGVMGVMFKSPLYLPVVEHIWRTHPPHE